MIKVMSKTILILTVLLFGIIVVDSTVSVAATKSIELGNDQIRTGNQIHMANTGVDNPVAWNVISDQTNTDDDGKLLIAAESLGEKKYNYVATNKNAWQGSDLQSWCINYFQKNFTDEEKKAVINTSKLDASYDMFGPSALTEDNLFVLSAEEANKYFSSNADRQPAGWWLRSPFFNDGSKVAVVYKDDGHIHVSYVDNFQSVRPAFNMNPESVLFSSAAEGGKVSGTVGAECMKAVPEYEGAWKLTFKDDAHKDFSASAGSDAKLTNSYGATDWTIPINYSGALTGTNEYVSVILVDVGDDVLYYGNIANNSEKSPDEGVNVKIPDGLDEGYYTLYVFSEQINGDKRTDYASPMERISIRVTGEDDDPEFPEGTFLSKTGKYKITNKTKKEVQLIEGVVSDEGVVTIPKTVIYEKKKYKVTSIRKMPFDGNSKVKTIKIIAGNLKKVGKYAFRNINNKAVFKIKGTKKQFEKVKKLIKASKGLPKGVKFRR